MVWLQTVDPVANTVFLKKWLNNWLHHGISIDASGAELVSFGPSSLTVFRIWPQNDESFMPELLLYRQVYRLGQPVNCMFLLLNISYVRSNYPKNILFDFESKITDACQLLSCCLASSLVELQLLRSRVQMLICSNVVGYTRFLSELLSSTWVCLHNRHSLQFRVFVFKSKSNIFGIL